MEALGHRSLVAGGVMSWTLLRLKGLRHGRGGSGLALRDQQGGFPTAVDEIHPAHNEEQADKTDEYGACGKGVSQGKNHAVRSG